MNEWWVPALVLLLVAVIVIASVVLLRRHRAAATEEPLHAEPEDRPVPAVVANPIRIEPSTRARITATCTSLGWAEPLWLETTVDDPGTGQALAAVEQGADVVLACGGDGTVRSVAQALAGTGVAMGLVPMGTGNLLAKEVGVPSDAAAATRVALTGDDRTIDVGRIRVDGDPDERVFLVMAGTGLDAAIMENTDDALKARVGRLAYFISGFRAMFAPQTRLTVAVDGGTPMRRRSRTVVVGNIGTLLGGLVLMPAATFDDARLDIVNIAPQSFAGWVAVLLRVITRRRHGHRRIEHWQATSVVITTEQPQAAQIDGDPIGEVRELRMRVDPGVLVVRIPAGPEPLALPPGSST
ncbi:diacylglycerol/lipid kinase family protein [Pseudonocardia sp. CA-107938]|uniref:diacylglycerol/lipid kinase family protein n=1 Tax=Pseudonocardia sp. CA-107938 TaxID=3240021 RepID=UPI003D8F0451